MRLIGIAIIAVFSAITAAPQVRNQTKHSGPPGVFTVIDQQAGSLVALAEDATLIWHRSGEGDKAFSTLAEWTQRDGKASETLRIDGLVFGVKGEDGMLPFNAVINGSAVEGTFQMAVMVTEVTNDKQEAIEMTDGTAVNLQTSGGESFEMVALQS